SHGKHWRMPERLRPSCTTPQKSSDCHHQTPPGALGWTCCRARRSIRRGATTTGGSTATSLRTISGTGVPTATHSPRKDVWVFIPDGRLNSSWFAFPARRGATARSCVVGALVVWLTL